MLHIFYQIDVASAIFFATICSGSSIRASDTERLKSLLKAGSLMGTALEPLEVVVEKRTLRKLLTIMDNTLHPLYDLLIRQQSAFSSRLLQLCCNKNHYFRFFLFTAIKLYNDSMGRERRQQNQNSMLPLFCTF